MKNNNRIRTSNRVQSGQIASNAPAGGTQIVKRALWQRLGDVLLSQEVASPTDSYLTVGTSYGQRGINYRIREFMDVNLLNNYDAYRIDRIDVYAQKSDTARNVTLFSSFDIDDSTAITWQDMSRRQNVKTTSLKINEPRKKVASFVPVINFNNTGSSGADSPQNVIMTNKPWIDASATNNSYNGIKFWAAADDQFSVTFHAHAHISLKGKI